MESKRFTTYEQELQAIPDLHDNPPVIGAAPSEVFGDRGVVVPENGGNEPEPTPVPEGFVDLGLPSGTLWAKTNIGAQSETDYGDYYQWAATTPLSVSGTTVDPAADWSLCPYTDNEGNPSKYTGSDYDTLQTSDDVVASQFTGYRIPTQDDFQELIDETDNEWVEDFNDSGVNGYKFTNKSDSSKYIFLPAAGGCGDSNLIDVGGEGGYWSSSLNTDGPSGAWSLYFDNGEVDMDGSNRYDGFTVRPVKAKTE